VYEYMCMRQFVDSVYQYLLAYSGQFGPSGQVHRSPGQFSPGPKKLGIGLIPVQNFL